MANTQQTKYKTQPDPQSFFGHSHPTVNIKLYTTGFELVILGLLADFRWKETFLFYVWRTSNHRTHRG